MDFIERKIGDKKKKILVVKISSLFPPKKGREKEEDREEEEEEVKDPDGGQRLDVIFHAVAEAKWPKSGSAVL